MSTKNKAARGKFYQRESTCQFCGKPCDARYCDRKCAEADMEDDERKVDL